MVAGRTLGIDYGERRIGLALSDFMGVIASPFDTITHHSTEEWQVPLLGIIADNEVVAIVVGYPLNMKGESSAQTKDVDQFIEALKTITPLPISTWDERLTSVAAKRSLAFQGVKTGHNKGAVDQTAAAIFLQDYLDAESIRSNG